MSNLDKKRFLYKYAEPRLHYTLKDDPDLFLANAKNITDDEFRESFTLDPSDHDGYAQAIIHSQFPSHLLKEYWKVNPQTRTGITAAYSERMNVDDSKELLDHEHTKGNTYTINNIIQNTKHPEVISHAVNSNYIGKSPTLITSVCENKNTKPKDLHALYDQINSHYSKPEHSGGKMRSLQMLLYSHNADSSLLDKIGSHSEILKISADRRKSGIIK